MSSPASRCWLVTSSRHEGPAASSGRTSASESASSRTTRTRRAASTDRYSAARCPGSAGVSAARLPERGQQAAQQMTG